MLFKEITGFYFENIMKPTDTFNTEIPIVKVGGTYNYQLALNG
jgi:hypothetical protein